MSGATEGARTGSGRWRTWARRALLYVIIPALLLGATALNLRFKHFVERDPAFCGMCHQASEAEALWARSEHKSIVCQDCHHQSQREAIRMLAAYSLGQRPDGSAGGAGSHRPELPINACARCHLSHDKAWPEVANATGHKRHLATGKVSCLDCHGSGIHRFGAALDACQRCHGPHRLRTTAMDTFHCLACHNFLNREETLKPPARVCVACHRSRGVVDEASFPANAPMAKLQCWACHRPHADDKKALVDCVSCHEKLHGSHRKKGHDRCADCHEAHTWVSRRSQCLKCHREMASHNGDRECVECHDFSLSGKDAP